MTISWLKNECESSIIGKLDRDTYAQAQRVVASHSESANDCNSLLMMLGIRECLAVDDSETLASTTAPSILRDPLGHAHR
ncbi:hypothetical protein FHU29_003316 [Hoyosella altamirensis]|uniref:Uncharacterized protein n=1 Tax=Hoyosella altamirensis TaxID=616997 RepID=A0A839RR57_9ACTN|nr:hypothetical protein [Hoyosella altamirensis]